MNSMDHLKQLSTVWRFAFCCFAAAAVLPVAAAETPAPAAGSPPVPVSVFKQPATPREGRDPFFPTSQRLFASAVIPNAETKDLSSLVIQGKSGTPERPLVIINEITFAVGDYRDVITPQGRIHIHCLEIIGDTAVIEANGQRHKLRFESKP